MTKMSFIDKLGVLVNVSKESKLFIILLVVLIILGFTLSLINPRNEKMYKRIYIGTILSILIILLIAYHSSLGKMFQYMMNHFFIALFFPNIAIYFAALIVMNIILWISVFNYKSSKQIRTLNIGVFIVMNYLLALILNTVAKDKLDVFSESSIYENQNARALIELSSTIFIVWIIFLILYKIILIYLKKDYKPKVKKIIIRKKVKKLPENYIPTTIPDFVYGNVPHKDTLIIKDAAKENEIILNDFENRFTLEEYKLFSKILKEQQMKKKKNNIKIEIPKIEIEYKDDNNIEKKYSATSSKQIEEKYNPPKQIKETIKEEIQDIIPEIVIDNKTRDEQKQEIIKMEEERRELLRKEQERLEEQRKQQELEEKRRREERKVEHYLQQKLQEETEQAKLTELERLYRSIR